MATSDRSNGTSCNAHSRRSARYAGAGELPSNEQSRRSRLTRSLLIVETALAFWTHRTDGTIHTPETYQASGLRPPALVQRNDDGGWDFDACGVRRPARVRSGAA